MPLPPPPPPPILPALRRRNFRLFWCYQCRRPVSILPSLAAASDLFCPRCFGPFVQHLDIPSLHLPPPPPPPPPHFHFLFPPPHPYLHLHHLPLPPPPPPPPPPPLHGDYYAGPNLSELIHELTESDRTGPPPASSSSIDMLPTVAITAAHLRGCSECPVCKEEFFVGEEAREMPCQHAYHSDCIVPWLRLHNSCPVCRCRLSGEEPAAGEGNRESASGGGRGTRRRRRRPQAAERWNPVTMLSTFRGSLSPGWDRRRGGGRPELQDSDPLDSPAVLGFVSLLFMVALIISSLALC